MSSNLTTIGNSAFIYCSALTAVIIPDSVTSFGSNAFRYCTSLTELTIPANITTVSYRSFADCTGLTSITISDGVEELGKECFSGCTSLTDISIPDSVTNIESYTLSDCTSLTEVTLPKNLTTIGSFAFSGDTSLTSIIIPEKVTSFGSAAFCNCTALTDITFYGTETEFGSSVVASSTPFMTCTALQTVYCVEDSVYDDLSLYPDGVAIVYIEQPVNDEVYVGLDSASVIMGSEVSVPVTISGCETGVSNFDITVSYDSTYLTYTGYTQDIYQGTVVVNSETESTLIISAAAAENYTGDGTLISLIFTANKTTEKNIVTETGLEVTEMCYIAGSESVKTIDSTVTGGSILINTVGDLNCDQEVTATDATFLLLSSAGLREASEEMLIVADLNDDGQITATDATLILLASANLRNL